MEEYSEVFYYKCIDVKIGNGPIDFRERLARLPARISDFNRDMTDLKLQNYRKKYRKEVASFQDWGFVFRKWGFVLDSGTIGERSFWGVGV